LTAAITGFLKASSRARHGLAAPDEVAHGRIATALDAAGEFVDIGARGKRAFARAGQDHGAHAGVDLDRVQHGHQVVDQRVVQDVELVGRLSVISANPSLISSRIGSDI
jgi:hypothetical protein